MQSRFQKLACSVALATSFLAWTAPILNAQYSYIQLDAPLSSVPSAYTSLGSYTTLIGVTSYGEIGIYEDPFNMTHSFVYTAGSYKNFGPSMSQKGVIAQGVYGNIVYGAFLDVSYTPHGFLYDGTNTDSLVPTGSGVSNQSTIVGITSFGVVGTYVGTNSTNYSFVAPVSGITVLSYSNIVYPNALAGTTIVTDASSNAAFGTYTDTNNNTNYFTFDGTNYESITFPSNNSLTSSIVGLLGNSIVGNTTNTSIGGGVGAVIYSNSIYTFLHPGVTNTATGVSGYYIFGTTSPSNNNTNGFVLDTSKGTYTFLNDTDPLEYSGTTVPYGVYGNLIFGSYMDANYDTFSFIYNQSNNSYSTFSGPPNGTQILGVSGYNAIGTSVDIYGDQNYFFYDGTNYIPIDEPNSIPGGTTLTGISGNIVIGWYIDTNSLNHGFVYEGTNYTTIDEPNSIPGTTTLAAISGTTILGSYVDSNAGVTYGFTLDVGYTNYTPLYGPQGTNGWGISPVSISGSNVVGNYTDRNNYNQHAFLVVGTNYTPIFGPTNSAGTNGTITTVSQVCGGTIVGNYTDTNLVTHGFIYSQGNYTTLDDTSINAQAGTTIASSVVIVNSETNVLGTYQDTNSLQHSFVFNGTTYMPMDYPSSLQGYTIASGLTTNTIYGNYIDINGLTHGYLQITKANQALILTNLPAQDAGSFVNLPSTSSTGLPVTYTVTDGAGYLEGNTLIFTGIGNITLVSSQAGNAYYNATSSTNFITVGKGTQTIPPMIQTVLTFGTSFKVLTTTLSSVGLPVTFTVAGPAKLVGTTLTPIGIGKVIITASQKGTTNFTPAPTIKETYKIVKGSQTLSPWSEISTQTNGVKPFIVTIPTSSSALPVMVSVESGPAKISGKKLTIKGVGTVVLKASQKGNATWLPAEAVTTSFVVTGIP